MSSPTPVLEIQKLTKHYGGVKALTDAQFRLLPGEHAAIVGDNGAGKSTFVRLITGAEQPNSGDILLDGGKVNFESPLDAREQGIETVYQTLALAEQAEAWGYHRFWVSEHHSHPSIVGSAPEVLMAATAARTWSPRS